MWINKISLIKRKRIKRKRKNKINWQICTFIQRILNWNIFGVYFIETKRPIDNNEQFAEKGDIVCVCFRWFDVNIISVTTNNIFYIHSIHFAFFEHFKCWWLWLCVNNNSLEIFPLNWSRNVLYVLSFSMLLKLLYTQFLRIQPV